MVLKTWKIKHFAPPVILLSPVKMHIPCNDLIHVHNSTIFLLIRTPGHYTKHKEGGVFISYLHPPKRVTLTEKERKKYFMNLQKRGAILFGHTGIRYMLWRSKIYGIRIVIQNLDIGLSANGCWIMVLLIISLTTIFTFQNVEILEYQNNKCLLSVSFANN